MTKETNATRHQPPNSVEDAITSRRSIRAFLQARIVLRLLSYYIMVLLKLVRILNQFLIWLKSLIRSMRRLIILNCARVFSFIRDCR